MTGVRAGKLIAQACHASMSFLTRQLQKSDKVKLSKAAQQWIEESFAKVCLQVDSEQELLDVYQKAIEVGLEAHLITDSGKTEFGGVPTKTCLALGPDYVDRFVPVTGHLKLY